MTWFADWLHFHLRLHPRGDWPKPKSADFEVFFSNWRNAFSKRAVSEPEAHQASVWLSEQPPSFADGHLTALLGRISETRLLAAQAAHEARRQEQRRINVRIFDRRQLLRERWRALPPEQSGPIREAAIAEDPSLGGPFEPFLESVCMERAVVLGVIEDPDPQVLNG